MKALQKQVNEAAKIERPVGETRFNTFFQVTMKAPTDGGWSALARYATIEDLRESLRAGNHDMKDGRARRIIKVDQTRTVVEILP